MHYSVEVGSVKTCLSPDEQKMIKFMQSPHLVIYYSMFHLDNYVFGYHPASPCSGGGGCVRHVGK